MTWTSATPNWNDIHYTSRDGLKLYARRYGARSNQMRPVLCLPGLTRNSSDFHMLATYLAEQAQPRRTVYSVDYRGRGRSQYDSDWHNYSPLAELADVLDLMALCSLHNAAIVGTSRGGVIAMIMAAVRPGAIGVAVLNDIGPEIEIAGIARILGYVGRTPLPGSWDEAVGIVKRMNAQFFPAVSDAEWLDIARQFYLEEEGRPARAYDADLARPFAELDLGGKLPNTWPQFMALTRVPTLAIRGELSDLLSAATLEAMSKRHPRLTQLTVEAQGHAPLLRDADSMGEVARFLAQNDAA